MHKKQYVTAGKELTKGSKVLLLLHGRGASAEDILGLANHLATDDFTLLAPQATNHTWYPYSFMAPPASNEPWLSSALQLIHEIVGDLQAKGISKDRIYLGGFSQGACLTLEYVTRYAARYGGVVAFTGGLIGDVIYPENYKGDFSGTPVFIGSSDPDPHVPVARVEESARIMESMNAVVTKTIYPQMGHTIIQDEIDTANKLVFAKETVN